MHIRKTYQLRLCSLAVASAMSLFLSACSSVSVVEDGLALSQAAPIVPSEAKPAPLELPPSTVELMAGGETKFFSPSAQEPSESSQDKPVKDEPVSLADTVEAVMQKAAVRAKVADLARPVAASAIVQVSAEEVALQEAVEELPLVRNPLSRDVVMEVRAKDNVAEADRVAADLFKLYSDYAAERGLRIVESRSSSSDGSRKIVFSVVGDDKPQSPVPPEAKSARVKAEPAEVSPTQPTESVTTPAEERDLQLLDEALVPSTVLSGDQKPEASTGLSVEKAAAPAASGKVTLSLEPPEFVKIDVSTPSATYASKPIAERRVGSVSLQTIPARRASMQTSPYDVDCFPNECRVDTYVIAGDWAAEMCAPAPWAREYPDEYLINGCDRDEPVHYNALVRRGLDTQDAVAEYVDDTGREHTQVLNCVAVYAPRFGTVRTSTGPSSRYKITGTLAAHNNTGSYKMQGRLDPVGSTHATPPVQFRSRRRVSGLDADTSKHNISGVSRLGRHSDYAGAFQNFVLTLRGEFRRSEQPALLKGMVAAQVWTQDLYPVITASEAGAVEVTAKFRPQEAVGIDEKGIGRLRIVKLADTKFAQPGESIEFTIRYDNLGETPLHYIHIVDNLTPRLEYVEDSASSDRPGDVAVEDNGEGSVVLNFKLDDSLPGGEGGVITFKARVR